MSQSEIQNRVKVLLDNCAERDKLRQERDEERLQISRLRAEIRKMQQALEDRNRQLDALHWVWCDGGCESGVHRFDGQGPEAITQEVVDTAERNTERLKRWWINRRSRNDQAEDSPPRADGGEERREPGISEPAE